MKKVLFILGAVCLPFLWQAASAQGCADAGDGEEGVKIIGFVQPQYEYHMTEEPSNTFKFKRARLGVMGSIPYDFFYYAMIETSSFVSKTGNPYLLDAFISYQRFQNAKISLGSFKQPFGLEVSTGCHRLPTIERAIVSDQLVAPQRDMGLMVLGGNDESLIRYSVAIMNGTGLSVKDNNSRKDFIGRLAIKPLDFLRVGGSFRYGWPNTKDDTRTSFAGEVDVFLNNFFLQGEYIYDQGDYSKAAGGGCGADPVSLGEKRSGFYGVAGYMTPINLQPVIKYEYFDPDHDNTINGVENSVITFGLNYFFNDWTRLQLNYQYKAEKGGEIQNDAILLQLQVSFM